MNVIVNAALVAGALNRTLCINNAQSRSLPHMESPLLLSVVGRRAECAEYEGVSEAFSGLDRVTTRDPKVAVTLAGWNLNPSSLGHPGVAANAAFYGADYDSAATCVSNALFTPSNELRSLAVPLIRDMRRADVSIGVHLRTSDKDMAQYQGYHGTRRLYLAFGLRKGCREDRDLEAVLRSADLVACARRMMIVNKKRTNNDTTAAGDIAFFVASDTIVDRALW